MILCHTCYQSKGFPAGRGRSWFWWTRKKNRWGKGLETGTKCKNCGGEDHYGLYTEYGSGWQEVPKPKFYKISPEAVKQGKLYMEKRAKNKQDQLGLMEKIRLYRTRK